MSTKVTPALNNDTENNNMCKIERGHDKTFSRAPISPVSHIKEPVQDDVVNNSSDNLAKLDLGTMANVKIPNDDSVAVYGVTHVGDMLKESSRPKQTVNSRQSSAKRRGKQPLVGVYGKPPVSGNGLTVAANKFHMKEKQLHVKEAHRRSMMRQKQLQDSEFTRVSVGQKIEKDGLDTSLFTVCKVQGDLSVPDPNLKKLQHSCLKQNHLEPPRCLLTLELSQLNNCHSDGESISPSSAKRRNEQKKKQQKNNTRQNNINEDERSVSVKLYASDDNQTHKLSTASSLNKDLQLTRELPDQGSFNRREPVNDLFEEKNDDNFISSVTICDVEATDSAEIQKDTVVVDPVTVMTTTTHLLKSRRLGHLLIRNKDNCHLRVQQSRQPEKHKMAGLSRSYILDSFKKVELNRDDVVFSETDLLGSGTFSQVFKGTYQDSEIAVKRLQTPLRKKDLNYFVSEISVLQELRHPHVAMLLGVCSRHDKFPLIVMELLAFGSLHTWLHGPGRTDLQRDEFYQIANDVSSGMLYLHQHKPPVLHLDLRPRNILIGLGIRAKVADFGFTKLRFKDDVKRHHTREPPTWLAPELFTSGEITPKADVYSFGLVLWEMLTRQYPYDSLSMFQILECLQASRRPTLPSDCPKGLSEIVQKCWDQNPAARPGFKEVLKCLELLSQTREWITSPVENPEHENQVMSLHFIPEYSKVVEHNFKTGLLKAEEKTSNIEHIDVISLSSQENEENNSCHDLDEKCLVDPQGSDPERSRFCDIISLTGSTSGLQASSDRKSSLCSTDDEQPRLHSQLSCTSSRSCLSLPDNEKDNEKMRHNTADQLKEMYLVSRKSSISVSKSQDSLRSSTSVKKLLPLRNSLDKTKVMPASCQGSGFTTPRFLNIKTRSQTVQHFLDEDISGRMYKHVDTNSDSVNYPALVSSSWPAKGQAIFDPININEDVLLVPCSEALVYVPSLHNKVTPVRPTQEPSGVNEACCQQSPDKDQNSNQLKKSLSCSHVGTQPVSMFMNSQNENQDDTSIKAHTIISGSEVLASNKSCRVHVMNKDSQVHMSPLGQTTNCSDILNTRSEQVEADRCHLPDSNIPHEKDNPLKNSHSLNKNTESVQIEKRHDVGPCSPDPERAEIVLERRLEPSNTMLTSQDACLSTYLCKSVSDSSIEIPSTGSSNIPSTTRSNIIKTAVAGCGHFSISSRSDDFNISASSSNIQTAATGSDDIPVSSRSDDVKISASSSNIQTVARSSTIKIAARSSSIQTAPTGSDIPISSRSDDTNSSNIRTSKRFSNIQIASDGSDNDPFSFRSDDTQTSKRSCNIRTSTRCSSIQTLTRSSNIQTASAGSDISVPSRSDETQTSTLDYIKPFTKSANILTHSARTCNSPTPVVISENVQIPSARSNHTQTLARLGETCGFRAVTDYCTELDNYSTSRVNETTSYESDSDSSSASDISQDSLNKDAVACPRQTNCSDHSDLTRYSSNALVMNADIILKNRINELPIPDNKKRGNSSDPCLTVNQGFNAHHARLQSEQKNTIQVTEVSMASINAEAIKCNKMHNTVDDRSSGCLLPKVRESYYSQRLELMKSHENTPQKECILRRKQKSNITEFKKDRQLEEAAQHNQMDTSSRQKRHFPTDLQSAIGAHASDTSFMLHHVTKAKDVLPLYSKQKLKHSEGTSRFSIEASILRNQKKLLKPVVTTASSFSANTLDSMDGSPTVITILKKAMADRRFAIGDIQESQDVTPGTSWSLEG